MDVIHVNHNIICYLNSLINVYEKQFFGAVEFASISKEIFVII